ncbi:caspase b-like [Garra rufa]|uniref:caspase b-like n=1 Tax=Garra rufa TaxID=137080 RepID=UPI003CCED33B
MASTKHAILDALYGLMQSDLEDFRWNLENLTEDEPIPVGKLENANRNRVVNLMVQQYHLKAGRIAVSVLRKINHNDLADKLQEKLPKVPEDVSAGGGASSGAAAATVSTVSTAGVTVTINTANGGTVKAPVLNGVLKTVQEDTRHAPVPVEPQLNQSEGKQGHMTHSTQEFKRRILQDMGDEIYVPTTSQRKGLALLITNIHFDCKKHNRDGAERDEENIEWLLKALGYNVEKHRNLSGDAIDKEVRDFSTRSEHQNSDSTFVVIMSHGKRINNRDAILGVHYPGNPNDLYFVDKTYSHLNSLNCPALIDKPKVILIQACRGGLPGGKDVQDQVAEVSDAWVHKEKDFVCFMSTLPDTVAYRNTKTGSHFINYIVEVFCEWAHKHDIMELFRKVILAMETCPGRTDNKLLPCLERTSVARKFYLFPGL